MKAFKISPVILIVLFVFGLISCSKDEKIESPINSKTVVVVTPYNGIAPAGGTKQYRAHAFKDANSTEPLENINFTWDLRSNVPLVNIGSISSDGLVSVNEFALPALIGVVEATIVGTDISGIAGLVVGEPCDCGYGNADVKNIVVNNSEPITVGSFGSTVDIEITAYDANGNIVDNPNYDYCVSDPMIADIGISFNEIEGIQPGTTEITICSGDYASATINVVVQ